MVSKTECYVNLAGCFILLGLIYYIMYHEPSMVFDRIKIVAPLLCFCVGYICHRTLNELAGVKQ